MNWNPAIPAAVLLLGVVAMLASVGAFGPL